MKQLAGDIRDMRQLYDFFQHLKLKLLNKQLVTTTQLIKVMIIKRFELLQNTQEFECNYIT